MSRSVFLSVVGIVTILSFVDTVDAQRFRNRNNDCGCQPNSQQYYQPNRANYQQRYQANYQQRYQATYQPNYRALAVRRNYVAAQRVPMGYYQQNAMLNYRNVQNPSLRYQPVRQAQMRPAVQYSVARGYWVPAQNPYGQTQVQYGRLPMAQLPAGQPNSAAAISQVAPVVATEPSEVQPATFAAPVENSILPLTAPESIQTVDPIPASEPAATSILDHGN
jgi:hypothetical protein